MKRLLSILCILLAVASAQAKEVEKLQSDLDGDGKPDRLILTLPDNWGDPGEFTRIDFLFGDGTRKSLEETAGWVSYTESAAPKLVNWLDANNSVHSSHVVLLDDPNGKVLFLFGFAYASSPGALEVIRFLHHEPVVVFHSEFWPEHLGVSDGTLAMLGRRSYPELWGKDYKCSSYVPFQVIKLTAPSALLDEEKTRHYNLQHYAGYAGPDYSEKHVVLSENGHQQVIDKQSAQERCGR